MASTAIVVNLRLTLEGGPMPARWRIRLIAAIARRLGVRVRVEHAS